MFLHRPARALYQNRPLIVNCKRLYISIEDVILGEDLEDYKEIAVKVGELPIAKFVKGRFICPWSLKIKTKNNPLAVLKWILSRKQNVLKFPVGLVKAPTINDLLAKVQIDNSTISQTNNMHLTWLGHSSCFFQSGGLFFLTDPVFSMRASPFQFIGPKRIQSAIFDLSQLAKLDVVLLSHTHYDHLDYDTALRIRSEIGNKVKWIVPLGVKKLLNSWGITNCVELSWWEKHRIVIPERNVDVEIVFTPTKHWTSRSLFDRNKCLWGSYVVASPQGRMFFGGDTAYCSVFKQIGELYGPFDVSALSIGAYKPRWFMKHVHCDPAEAVQIHKDLQSKQSVAIHWGTFPLADEDDLEPSLELARHRHIEKVLPIEFFTMGLGETVIPVKVTNSDILPVHDIAVNNPELFDYYVNHNTHEPNDKEVA